MFSTIALRACLLAALFIGLSAAAKADDSPRPAEEIELVKITTEHGEILIYLYEDTPLHRENFLKLARAGYFDGKTFDELIGGTVVEAGEVRGDETIPSEIKAKYYHKRGAVSALRSAAPEPDAPSLSGRFCIVAGERLKEQTFENLMLNKFTREFQTTEEAAWVKDVNWGELQKNDREEFDLTMQKFRSQIDEAFEKVKATDLYKEKQKIYLEEGGVFTRDDLYTVFGEVVSGMEAVDKMTSMQADAEGKLAAPVEMKCEVVSMKRKTLEEKYAFTPR